jgi:hypothetical protein
MKVKKNYREFNSKMEIRCMALEFNKNGNPVYGVDIETRG